MQFPNSEKRTWLWRASPELGPLWVSSVNNGLTPDKVASLHATYLGPVLTPDEVAALQARADQSALGYAREARRADLFKFLHKRNVAALQARVAELEAALREIEYLDRPQVRGLPRRTTIQEIARAALEGGKKDE